MLMKLYYSVVFLYAIHGNALKLNSPDPDAKGQFQPKIEIRSLPENLVKTGIEVFGSEDKLGEALNKSIGYKMRIAGVDLTLIADGHDNVFHKMNFDYGNLLDAADRYGIRTVKEKQGLIVDIGSNIGDVAVVAALIHPTLQILAIEPSPPTYFWNVLNLWYNNIHVLSESDFGGSSEGGVLTLNAAATKDGRPVVINWSEKRSMNAVIDSSAGTIKGWHQKSVPSVDISKFISDHQIQSIELFKIDCEGCEWEVIPTVETMISTKKIKRAVGELHSHRNGFDVYKKFDDPVANAVEQMLKEKGCTVKDKEFGCGLNQ